MPDTFQALFVILLAILPGGLYTWYFEREVGAWGAKAADRIPRLIGSSAIFLALFSYPAYLVWTNYLHRSVMVDGEATYENRIWQGDALPPIVFVLPLVYVVAPILLGWLSGVAVRRSHGVDPARWWRIVAAISAGASPAPRAWDHLFLGHPAGVIRIRLKEDDGWVGGLFRDRSYAAGYGEEPQDLLLEQAYAIKTDGTFVAGNNEAGYQELGSSLLVPFERIVHLEFIR